MHAHVLMASLQGGSHPIRKSYDSSTAMGRVGAEAGSDSFVKCCRKTKAGTTLVSRSATSSREWGVFDVQKFESKVILDAVVPEFNVLRLLKGLVT